MSDESDEGIDNIGKFNRFAQDCFEKYHITLVLATKGPDKRINAGKSHEL